MTLNLRSLLLSCAVVYGLPAAWAQQAEPAKSAEISGEDLLDDSEAVSQKLEAFIKGAVESGLLQSSDPEAVNGQDPLPEVNLQCRGLEVLNFEDFSNLETYEELIEFRNLLNKTEGLERDAAATLLSTAYISLGLESEAAMKLKPIDTVQADILKELLALVAGKPEALAERLVDAATCRPEARFWYGVAILEENTEQGADLFNQGIVVFRTLPFQLQASVAARAVPILERDGRKLLAQKIMASFTPDELRASSKLQFNQALLDISLGKPVDLRLVEGFLDRPSLSDNAMRAILAQDEQPYLINASTRVSDALQFIRQAETQRNEATRLHVVIKAFLKAERYEDIRSLADEPILSAAKFQDAIAHVLIAHVSDELDANSLQRRVAAVNFLLQDEGLLLANKSGRKLMQNAVVVARDGGFNILAGQLLEKLDNRLEALPDQAEHAFRRDDFEKVFALFDAHPANIDLAYYAGLAAIIRKDSARLASIEPALATAPMRLLELVEADVLAKSWLFPAETYARLETELSKVEDRPDGLERLARAKRIRERGMAAETPRAPDFNEVTALLAANRAELNALNEGSGS